MPPLSMGDKLIYWTVFLLLCGSYAALPYIPITQRGEIAYADPMVIANESDVGSMLWCLVPWFTYFLMTFILWYMAYYDRKPIFGRKNFKYGPPAWPKIYPLFMKNKPPVWVSERKKKQKRELAVLLVVILLLSFIPYPWSLYGRQCLMEDGSIVEYNEFNRKTREFSPEEIASVEMETYRYRPGKQWRKSWGVRLNFKTESGETYSFSHMEFDNDTPGESEFWVESMLEVMKFYDTAEISFEGVENLEQVIYNRGLDWEEAEMLFRLFGQLN